MLTVRLAHEIPYFKANVESRYTCTADIYIYDQLVSNVATSSQVDGV